MNFFDEQMVTYSLLLNSLKAYARKPDGSLKAAEIRPHDRCPLGKWIDAERPTHGALAEHRRLEEQHARFHVAAADVVTRIDEAPEQAEAAADDIAFKKTFADFLKALVALEGEGRLSGRGASRPAARPWSGSARCGRWSGSWCCCRLTTW